MKRLVILLGIVVAAISITAVVAFAVSVHLKAKPPLTFTDNTGPAPATNLTLSTSGALTGLGNGDVVIAVSATANPTAQCCNPGAECKVPGHNPAAVNLGGVAAFPGADIKNGNLSFSVSTKAPSTSITPPAECPNNSWTETITDLVFITAHFTVFQPAVLACVMGSNNGTSCTSDSGCTGGGSCAPVDANTGGTALAVFATTCNLSGVDGILGKSCP